jgi:hypothetical protein
MDYTNYANTMIQKALQTEGKEGPIEFPAYEKKVKQNLDGILGMGVKGTDFFLAQAQMDAIWAGNKDGKFSLDRQAFEIRSRGIHIEHPDPPATQLNSAKMIMAEATKTGRVYMSARFDVASGDYKIPDIAKLKKDAGYTDK